MYKTRENLYALYSPDSILAISDNEKNIYQYYLEFKSYFDETYSQVSVVPIVTKNKIYEIIAKHNDTHWLYWLTDEIILTATEYNYYSKYLRKMYEDTKNMMSQLLILNKFTNLSPENKKKISDTFDITYNNMKSFNDFVSTIDSKEFFNQYIATPNITRQLICLDLMKKEKIKES